MENYINDGLDNTTIELLQGEIEIEFLGLDGDDENGEEDEEGGGGGSSTPHVLSDLATKGHNITLNIPGQSIKVGPSVRLCGRPGASLLGMFCPAVGWSVTVCAPDLSRSLFVFMLTLRSVKCNWANAWTLRQNVSP